MTGERRMRLLLLAFGGAAAAFMVWSLWLIRSVGRNQARLADTVALVSHMRDLEPSLRELEDVESGQVLLQSAAGISADLDQERRQLDYVAFIACLLAALATALVEMNRRDTRRRLRAEGSLLGAHEALEARALELSAANEKLQDEIAQRTRSEQDLATRSAELERSNAELERFAYVASHDLQEPLRAVASHVQILKEDYEGKLDADADESIRHAVEGAAHMRLLINDLLAYSRIGRRNEALQPTSSGQALATALRQLEVAVGESGARIVRDEWMPEVLADPLQLIQVFQNLVGNAIKFRGKTAPTVRISVERQDAAWTFTVRDDGIGFEPQHAERIFAPFERLHGRHEYPGTGIGLAICKKIVERHGGRIWVESSPGHGAAFHFTLGQVPIDSIPGALPAPAPEPTAASAASGLDGR